MLAKSAAVMHRRRRTSPTMPRIRGSPSFELLASGDASDRREPIRMRVCMRRRCDRDDLGSGSRSSAAQASSALVAVHRLREVACLYGFTRFEPAPLATDELEDVGLAVSGAPLGQSPDWLPAVEQFGEGFFLQFSPGALEPVAVSPAGAGARAGQLQSGATAWVERQAGKGQTVSENSFGERERPEYVMAHSLAHALMTEVAIDCGYPASALKERLYVLPRMPGQPIRCGILIYTATAGQSGHAGWSRRGDAAVRATSQVRPGTRAPLLRRSRLRGPRSVLGRR